MSICTNNFGLSHKVVVVIIAIVQMNQIINKKRGIAIINKSPYKYFNL